MTNEHVSINSEFEKAINELNAEIEKLQLAQKGVPILSDLYKDYTEKELELQKKKLQLIKNRSNELSKLHNKAKSPATRIIETLEKIAHRGEAENIFYLVKSLDNLLYSTSKDDSCLTQENYDSIKEIISKLEGEVLTFKLNKLNYDAVETLTRCISRLKSF